MQKIYFVFILWMLLQAIASGDTLILTSGKVVEGKVIHETPVYIRIQLEGAIEIQEYLVEQIQSVTKDGQVTVLREPVTPAQEGRPVESTPEPIAPVIKSYGPIDKPSSSLSLSSPSGKEESTTSSSVPAFRETLTLDDEAIQKLLASRLPKDQAEQQNKTEQQKSPWSFKPRDGLIAGFIFIILMAVGIWKKRKAPLAQKKKEQAEKEPEGLPEVTVAAEADKEQAVPKSTINERNYWYHVMRTFIYPLRGHVLFATISGSIFFMILSVAMFAPFYGLIVTVMFACYVAACMVSIIETAVTIDREDVFELPDFFNWFDWLGKTILLVLGMVLSYAPAIAYIVTTQQPNVVFFLFIGLGIFIAPMYILAVSLVGGLESLNIVNIFKSIAHTFVPYLLTIIFSLFVQCLNVLINMFPLAHIPVWGAIVRWFIFVYFLFVNMRLLGIFYKAHRLKLRWYGEDE